MKTLLYIFACVISLGFTQSAIARQNPTRKISGVVADSITRKPLSYITITLKADKNFPLKTTLSKEDGSFSFAEIQASKYSLSFASVGYFSQTRDLDLSDTSKASYSLGTIYLRPQSKELKEVSITADRPVIKQEVDRIAYDLQADPESKGSSVLEMMRKVPMLSVDGDDNVNLKGSRNYKILVNGKPSSMMERNAKDVLRSMPASSIQKIEVITSPPAKYDAEGLTGIINIITNKKVENGYNANVNTSYRFPVGGPRTGGSFTLKQGRFGASGYGGGSVYNTPRTESFNKRVTRGANATSLSQNGLSGSNGLWGYWGSELSYEIDTLNLLSGEFNINGSRSDRNWKQTSELSGNNGLIDRYLLDNQGEESGSGLDASLNYQRSFKADKNRLLTLSYRYSEYGNEQFKQIGLVNFTDDLLAQKQRNEGEASEQTVQLDYVYPVKKLTVEAGVKGIFRINNSNFQYDSLKSGNYVRDYTRSNIFDNHQNVYSIYNSYQYSLKNWGFKAGLRLEQTVIRGGADLNQNYINLVPSVSVNRNFENKSSLGLSFNRRMQRPGIFQLNPFIDRSNPSLEESGNPNLRPMTIRKFELKYSWFKKGSVNVALGYEKYNSIIMPATVFDPETNITRTRPDNTGKARLIFSNVSVNYPLTKELSFTANGFGGFGKVKGLVNGVLIENDGFMYHFAPSANYRLKKGWKLNAGMNLNGPNLSLQGTSNRFVGCSMGINKDLMKDKLTLSASANNFYSKFRTYRNFTEGPDFSQENNSQNYLRSFNLSLNYRFGQLKGGLKKNKKGIINDDVSGGNKNM